MRSNHSLPSSGACCGFLLRLGLLEPLGLQDLELPHPRLGHVLSPLRDRAGRDVEQFGQRLGGTSVFDGGGGFHGN
mgnify:CR=1 FL=1